MRKKNLDYLKKREKEHTMMKKMEQKLNIKKEEKKGMIKLKEIIIK